MVVQLVLDFLSALKKENRSPPSENRVMDKSVTLPSSMKSLKIYGSGSEHGSRMVNSREKKTGLAARKDYAIASIEELKGLSAASMFSIIGQNKGGRGGGRRSTEEPLFWE